MSTKEMIKNTPTQTKNDTSSLAEQNSLSGNWNHVIVTSWRELPLIQSSFKGIFAIPNE